MTNGVQFGRRLVWTGPVVTREMGAPALACRSRKPEATVDWAELIGRVATSGDREAFKVLFQHFAPRVKGFLQKTGCSADEAEELAQQTLLAVWHKAGQFDPSSSGAAAWIFTIARNLRIDQARRAARAPRVDRAEQAQDEADPADSAETRLARAEDVARITSALLQLSADQSLVIRMSFIDELAHPEIAQVLGIPLGTVKSRIRLAMKRLRDLLDQCQ